MEELFDGEGSKKINIVEATFLSSLSAIGGLDLSQSFLELLALSDLEGLESVDVLVGEHEEDET